MAQRTVCSAQEMVVAMDGGGCSLVHGHGYWRLGSATVATGAGANRVVPAVVWLSQAGHSGSARLSYGLQRLWLVQAGGVVVVTAGVIQGFAMGGRK